MLELARRIKYIMPNQSIQTDILIVGSGAAGLFAALQIPAEKHVLLITKKEAEQSDSFLAQGGICVLRDLSDYESYYQDTLKAGHYENNPAAVHTMIASSRTIINQLLTLGVPFAQENGTLCYTRKVLTRRRAFYIIRTRPEKPSPVVCWSMPNSVPILRF